MVLSRGVIVAATVALALSACGDATGDAQPAEPAATVIASTSIWADISSEVLCGRDVPSIVPAGADPHTFEPSLRDRAMIDDALVIITNGDGLEGNLADLVAATDATIVEMTRTVTDDLIDGDPHIWQNVQLVARAIDLIVAATEPLGLDTCEDDYRERLNQLDLDIIGLLQPVPPGNRLLVTSHDSLAYFAARYGLDVVGTVIPATNTLAQTNAADLAALADEIEERDVHAIFTERLESTADADALAARLGVRVVPLVTDALTDDETTDTYVEMMLTNATLIAEALAP